MEKPLLSALLLFFLGCTAWAGLSDRCRLGLYGMPQLDASEESSPRSSTCPGKTRAADSPAKETSRRPWIRLGASAQEISRSPTEPPGKEECDQRRLGKGQRVTG